MGILLKAQDFAAFVDPQLVAPEAGGDGERSAYGAFESGDVVGAAHLWQALAAGGDQDAANNLGVLLYRGHGVPQDFEQAVRLFSVAAEKGCINATTNLAFMKANGFGTPKDNDAAGLLFLTAAEKLDAVAAFNLAYLYVKGRFGPRDVEIAYMWFVIAAAVAHESDLRARATAARDYYAANIPPTNIIRVQRQARDWYAGRGDAAPTTFASTPSSIPVGVAAE